ncbi:hypothetical protein ncot_14475 [Nocardioides sp. JQ2195]|uniref:LpqB family beta-propeller domain-containing protein n=1 Tax=Nocardioides sp. JQ2195 TaxID=2592334 RepID=UPI00143E916E|nr:LpqB family beta-propeller domain-containing protein [Nocardioides sp. JQ2195]QIX27666.1 hypothetical protein ncot_14475 [Nocardioides sp. JQ2195]
MTVRTRGLVLAVVALMLCSACVSMPDSGDVQVGDDTGASSQDPGYPYDPRPPQPGERATEIVSHFLDAMMANPTTTAVAKQFLSEDARESWHPERQMITYDDIQTPSGTNEVSVTLLDANHLDARGAWQGPVSDKQRVLSFGMTVEDGEWRIADPPDAMIVSDEFFEGRYRQASLYFVDPTARVVVPEPVFVPRSGQLSAVLMRGLLRGPGARLDGVLRSYIPDDMNLDLSAPVSADGVAEVSLRGDITTLDPESVELMTVQIAWTLRQDPSVSRVRLTINETPVTTSGSSSAFDVDIGEEYNPIGANSWQGLFGLREGRVVSSISGRENHDTGPFGTAEYGLRTIAVNLQATQIAGVTSDGRSVLSAPTSEGEAATVSTLAGGSDFLEPAWDVSNRLWLVDRTSGGAVVSYVRRGQRHVVPVPGVSGKRVTHFLVSRDGTRLIAVLRRKQGDVVVQSRIALAGNKVRGTPATVTRRFPDELVRIRALAWHSPTEVVMSRVITNDLTQLTTVSVDGSDVVLSADVPIELVRDKVVRLVGSPDPASGAWAVAASGKVYDLTPDSDVLPPKDGLLSLTYVG